MQPVWLIDRKHNEQKNAMRCDAPFLSKPKSLICRNL
jgi:hypothetical protein